MRLKFKLVIRIDILTSFCFFNVWRAHFVELEETKFLINSVPTVIVDASPRHRIRIVATRVKQLLNYTLTVGTESIKISVFSSSKK